MKKAQPTIICALLALTTAGAVFAEESRQVGRDASGLPGISRVGVAVHEGKGIALSGTAGYGFTEGIVEGDSAHHRGTGRLGLAATPTDWLQLALRLDGRYDVHPDDSLGADDGMVGDPWLVVRSGGRLNENWALGGELGAWFPGADAPSVELSATTLEAKLLLTKLRGAGDLVLASMAGFRLDRSTDSVGDPDTLRRGDRIALGASDFNAALVGVGLAYWLGATELVTEVSADLLIGAPAIMQSPIRAGAGVRQHLSEALQLEGMLTASLSERPQIGDSADLIAIEPRLSATLGLKYVFDLGPSPPKPRAIAPTPPPKKPKPVAAKLAKPKATAAPVTGVVTDSAGRTLAQVNVTLQSANTTLTTVTDDSGRYQFSDVPFGEISIRAETADFAPGELSTKVTGDGSEVELSALKLRFLTLHAQVQGLVRAFSGEPLRASVRIEPPGTEHVSAADGRFAIDVEPGTYTVTISAPGHEPQTRTVLVPEKGVIIFNADLRKQRE